MPSNAQQSPEQEAERLKNIGNEFFVKQDYAKAEAFYSASILTHTTAVALSNCAQVFLHLNEPCKAYNDACEAIEMDPNLFKARYRMAAALLQLDQKVAAIRHLELCVGHIDVCKQLEELRSALPPADKNDESIASRLEQEADDLMKKKCFGNALELYTAALNKHHCAGILEKRAEVFMKLEKPRRSYVDANEAILLDKYSFKAYDCKMQCYYLTMRNEKGWAVKDKKETMKAEFANAQAQKEVEKNGFVHRVTCHNRQSKIEEDGIAQLFISEKQIVLVLATSHTTHRIQMKELGHVLSKCRSPIQEINFHRIKFDKKLMNILRSANSICWAGKLTFTDIPNMSRTIFNELFGKIMEPKAVQFYGINGLGGEFTSSTFLSTLSKLHGVLIRRDCQKKANGKVDLKAVYDYLHNFEATEHRYFVVDLEYLDLNVESQLYFDQIFQLLVERMRSDPKSCPYALIIDCPVGTETTTSTSHHMTASNGIEQILHTARNMPACGELKEPRLYVSYSRRMITESE